MLKLSIQLSALTVREREREKEKEIHHALGWGEKGHQLIRFPIFARSSFW
jgi:hypothetical protein